MKSLYEQLKDADEYIRKASPVRWEDKMNFKEWSEKYYSDENEETLHKMSHAWASGHVNMAKKCDDLQDFCIWLTGCGYDFCQHDYFIKQRDKLLKD